MAEIGDDLRHRRSRIIELAAARHETHFPFGNADGQIPALSRQSKKVPTSAIRASPACTEKGCAGLRTTEKRICRLWRVARP